MLNTIPRSDVTILMYSYFWKAYSLAAEILNIWCECRCL